MRVKSIGGSSADEISKALDEAISDGFAPTLAIVFLSIKQDITAICKVLNYLNKRLSWRKNQRQ